MEAKITSIQTKSVEITEQQFDDLTGNLVPADPDDVSNDLRHKLGHVRTTEEWVRKIEHLDAVRKELNMIMSVYAIREAFANTNIEKGQ